MPSRILREGILTSERVAALAWDEEVFYRRLMSVVDDFGRFHANPKLVRAACYPLHLEKVSDADIVKWLRATEKAGLVSVYPALDGKRYLEMLDFRQQVRAKESKFPSKPEQPQGTGDASATHMHSKRAADVHLDGGGGEAGDGIEDGGEGEGAPRAHGSPTPAEVCKAIRAAGIPSVLPGNQMLLTLLEAGATLDEFLAAAPKAVGRRDGFAYLLGTVKGQREDAAKAARGLHRGPMPQAPPAQRTTAVDRQTATMNALTGKDRNHGRDTGNGQGSHATADDGTIDVAARVVPG